MGDAWEGRRGMVGFAPTLALPPPAILFLLSFIHPPAARPAPGARRPGRPRPPARPPGGLLAWLALARRYLCVACVWRLWAPIDVRWNCPPSCALDSGCASGIPSLLIPPFITTCARSNRRARAHTLMMNSGGSQRRVKQRRESGVDAVAASPASRPGAMPACRRCWEELSVQERQTAALLGFEHRGTREWVRVLLLPPPSPRREKGVPLLPPPWRELTTHPNQPHLRPRRRVAVAPSPPLMPPPPQHIHPEEPSRPLAHAPPLPPLPLPQPPVSRLWATPCGQAWPSRDRTLGSAALPI